MEGKIKQIVDLEKLDDYVKKNYGKCEDVRPGCDCYKAWKKYRQIKQAVEEFQVMEDWAEKNNP